MITVYTTAFSAADSDILQPPDCEFENDTHWVVLTDKIITVPHPWKPQQVEMGWLDDWREGGMKATRCKILSHQIFKSDGTLVWMDNDIQLCTKPSKLVVQVSLENPIGVLGRDDRACIYTSSPNDDKLRQQLEVYEYRKYPKNAGISDTSILVRKPKNDVNWFEWAWWLQVQTFSDKDWVSFDYCLWELGMLDRLTVIEDVCYSRQLNGLV